MAPAKAILFDWDGTIVDSVPALFETDGEICRRLGVPFSAEIFKRTFSPNWRRKYEALGITGDTVQVAETVWAELFHSGDYMAFPGVKPALTRLAGCGYLLGIVTGGDRSDIEPQVARLGLENLLTIGVFGDETADGKPHPAPLLLALERAGGVLPEDAVYVGDAFDDVRMAVAAGARGVGITSMLATAQELRDVGASETAGSIAEWVTSLLGPEAEGDL